MKYLILSGGLGNQMFQYAFYISCKSKGIPVKLNRDLYEVNRMHNGYLLDYVFGVNDDEVTDTSRISVLFTRLLRRYHPFGMVYSDKPMAYDDKAFSTKAKYFDGCFINPKYFADIEGNLRIALNFRKIDEWNLEMAIKLNECNSVGVHIRRGDYLQNPIYGVCDENYYERAIIYITEMVKFPKFFVFSDDSEWCEGYMKKMGVNHQIINHNTGRESYKDMYLMTRCKHNIIANSTFSWWGAWLNDNAHKVVIAPSKWTTTIPMDKAQDSWHLMDV